MLLIIERKNKLTFSSCPKIYSIKEQTIRFLFPRGFLHFCDKRNLPGNIQNSQWPATVLVVIYMTKSFLIGCFDSLLTSAKHVKLVLEIVHT